ncbi:hypothetical protein MBLNU459_g5678t2 [Dothideomycetes sp. NU459]
MLAHIATAAACLFSLLSTVSAVNPVQVHGQDFVDSVTHKRFVIIGVDYQPGGQAAYGDANSQDPLSNATACMRDAALMQELGVNTIRSYNVDPTLNHDECASIFNSVGIYMLIDVNSPLAGQSIDRSNPSGSYTTSYLQHTFTVVEAFKSYPNTLGFFAGNEIINDVPTAGPNPPYIRAVQRDLKHYIAKHSSRTIPVGYSAADVRSVLQDTWAYLQCAINGSSTDASRSDFFGLNSYSWCGESATFESSGYNNLVSMFSNSTVPVFFSEYGCNVPAPRLFNEVQALYGPQMTALSGGLVYEWSQEAADYGLVQIYSNASVQLLGDYDNLQDQYNKINTTLLESSNSTAAALSPPECSSSLISGDGFSTDFDIPPPPSGATDLISSGVSNAPTGSIVPVTQTSVAVPVYASNGGLINGLAIKATNGSNTPSGDNTGASASASASASSTVSGSATHVASASATSTKTGAANHLSAMGAGSAAAIILGAGIFAL